MATLSHLVVSLGGEKLISVYIHSSLLSFIITIPTEYSLVQKLVIAQLVKKCPFYGINMFITALIGATEHCSDPADQSTPLYLIAVRCVLICPTICLGLQYALFLSDFPTKILHSFLISTFQFNYTVNDVKDHKVGGSVLCIFLSRRFAFLVRRLNIVKKRSDVVIISVRL